MYNKVSQQNTFQYINLKKASIGQKVRKSYQSYQYPDSATVKGYLDRYLKCIIKFIYTLCRLLNNLQAFIWKKMWWTSR